jgi:probable HAF family extracellular repeat protein
MGERISRRSMVAGTVLGIASLAAEPARAVAGTVPGKARARLPRPRHRITTEPLISADGSLALFTIDDVNRLGQVVGRVIVGSSSSAALWEDGELTLLPTSVAGGYSTPSRLNDQGTVVGYCIAGGLSYATAWTGGVPRLLDIGTVQSTAEAINDNGLVVVRGWNQPSGETLAWSELCVVQDGTVTAITPPPSAAGTSLNAAALNNRGDVLVRGSYPQSGITYGFLWRDGATVADFTHIGGGSSYTLGSISGLNARGQVVGDYANPGLAASLSFLWTGSTLTDIDGLGGETTNVGIFGTHPLNDLGDVAGFTDLAPGDRHAFLWSAGTATDLGGLGGTSAYPVGVNNQRDVAGNATKADGTSAAFLWRDGELIELPPPAGYTSCSAVRITEQGTVLGFATTPTTSRYFRWTVD